MYDGMDDEYGIPHGVNPRRHDRALWFDRVDDYISTPITIPTNGPVTLAWMWFVNVKGLSLYHWSLFYDHPSFDTRLYVANAGNPFWVVNYSLRSWYHTVFSYDGQTDTLKYYHNGVLMTRFMTLTEDIPSTPLKFGEAKGGGSRFNGVLRDFYYYNRQVSDDEALEIYQGNPPDDYVSYWKGDGNTDAAWIDQKGTNHGTVYGTPEQCRVHRRGDVQRWDGSAWYSVT